MFPEEYYCTEGLCVLLKNTTQAIQKNDSFETIHKTILNCEKFHAKAELYEKSRVEEIKKILIDKLFNKAHILASTKCDNLNQKYSILHPVYTVIKDVEKNKPEHLAVFINIANRISGLEYYISAKEKAVAT
ncbi:MAG: hypothetical protein WCO65_02210 [bacterium]